MLTIATTTHSIPFFNDLLGVISALFASWFTYGISVSLSRSLDVSAR